MEHPQPAGIILQNLADLIGPQPLLFAGNDLEAVAIEAVEAVLGANPHKAATVLKQSRNLAVRKAVIRGKVLHVGGKRSLPNGRCTPCT